MPLGLEFAGAKADRLRQQLVKVGFSPDHSRLIQDSLNVCGALRHRANDAPAAVPGSIVPHVDRALAIFNEYTKRKPPPLRA